VLIDLPGCALSHVRDRLRLHQLVPLVPVRVSGLMDLFPGHYCCGKSCGWPSTHVHPKSPQWNVYGPHWLYKATYSSAPVHRRIHPGTDDLSHHQALLIFGVRIGRCRRDPVQCRCMGLGSLCLFFVNLLFFALVPSVLALLGIIAPLAHIQALA